jgi:hypothetical protein
MVAGVKRMLSFMSTLMVFDTLAATPGLPKAAACPSDFSAAAPWSSSPWAKALADNSDKARVEAIKTDFMVVLSVKNMCRIAAERKSESI